MLLLTSEHHFHQFSKLLKIEIDCHGRKIDGKLKSKLFIICDRLFTKVDPVLLSKPTYAAFAKLFNNYNAEAGVKEPKVSTTEVRNRYLPYPQSSVQDNAETKAFLDAIETTKPYQTLLNFLKARSEK